jgi:cation-transporting ATPase 13A1
MELSLAVNSSLLALHAAGVFCTEPFRIPAAGRVDSCCFDKTGTLTSDNMTVLGVCTGAAPRAPRAAAAPHTGGGGEVAGAEREGAPSVLPSLYRPSTLPLEAAACLAGCNGIVHVGGRVLGDPMERATLSAVGWAFARADLIVSQGVHRLHRGSTHLAAPSASLRVHHRHAFSSALRRMSVLATLEGSAPADADADDADGGGMAAAQAGGAAPSAGRARLLALAKGAPEAMEARFAIKPSDYSELFNWFAR